MHGWKLQRGCAQIYLISIIYAIESSILYILNVLNIFTFRYYPVFCVPHAYYTRVSCVKIIQIVLACFGESLLIYKLAYGTFRYFQQKLLHQKKGIASVRQSGDLTKLFIRFLRGHPWKGWIIWLINDGTWIDVGLLRYYDWRTYVDQSTHWRVLQ